MGLGKPDKGGARDPGGGGGLLRHGKEGMGFFCTSIIFISVHIEVDADALLQAPPPPNTHTQRVVSLR